MSCQNDVLYYFDYLFLNKPTDSNVPVSELSVMFIPVMVYAEQCAGWVLLWVLTASLLCVPPTPRRSEQQCATATVHIVTLMLDTHRIGISHFDKCCEGMF